MTDLWCARLNFSLGVLLSCLHFQAPQCTVTPSPSTHATCDASYAKRKEDESNGGGTIVIGRFREGDCGGVADAVLESESKTYTNNKYLRKYGSDENNGRGTGGDECDCISALSYYIPCRAEDVHVRQSQFHFVPFNFRRLKLLAI